MEQNNMTQHAIPSKKNPSQPRAIGSDSAFQRTAIHTTGQTKQPIDSAVESSSNSHLQSNLTQIPIHQPLASVQKKPEPASQSNAYQIATPKPSDDGYQEIAALSSDTKQQIGRVKIKGSPVQQKIEIASLWVDPEHRQSGISKSLMGAATQEGKKQGYRQAKLGVDPEAPGMSSSTLEGIYTKQGFKKTSHLKTGQPLMEKDL
jgi:ribosomal protein S18 acetylase RimI-like enzyme